jgi:hypothetical protein
MIKGMLLVTAVIFSSIQAIASEMPLEFEAGYIVDGVSGLQPSGLAVCDSKVVFVSDKHDSEIFQLTFESDGKAKVGLWKTITDIPQSPKQKYGWLVSIQRFLGELFGLTGGYDWEGIACNQQGDIFLASEYYFSVLKVDSKGHKTWVIDDLYQRGKQAGLFQKSNAYIEGIVNQENGLVLAAEREPYGFIRHAGGTESFYVQPGAKHSVDGLPNDYTGLDSYNGKLIALERNHYKVCELSGNYVPVTCYLFKDVAKSREWGYNAGKYGLAEGLVIEGDSLWIIVDNNGDSRKADSNDKRSTILKFKNPF